MVIAEFEFTSPTESDIHKLRTISRPRPIRTLTIVSDTDRVVLKNAVLWFALVDGNTATVCLGRPKVATKIGKPSKRFHAPKGPYNLAFRTAFTMKMDELWVKYG